MAENILRQFFDSPTAPEGALSLLELDGYLTAIVIGPELILPSEWLPALWRGKGMSGFTDPAQAQAVLGAVMERYNEIIRQLDKSPENYRPLYMPKSPRERPSSELAREWAQGFWLGVLLRSDAWSRLISDRKARGMLFPIICFIRDENGDTILPVQPEELDDFLIDAGGLIPKAIQAIRNYWRSKPEASAPPRRAKPKASSRRDRRCK